MMMMEKNAGVIFSLLINSAHLLYNQTTVQGVQWVSG